jgi:hypothetical protein
MKEYHPNESNIKFIIKTIDDFDNECCICYNTESLLKSDECDHVVCAPCYLQLKKNKAPHCPLCRICWDRFYIYTFRHFKCHECNKLYKKPTLYNNILYSHLNSPECLRVNHKYDRKLGKWIHRNEVKNN